MNITTRRIKKSDSKATCALYAEFVSYLRKLGAKMRPRMTEDIFISDGFGPHRAFVGWVALSDNRVIGYILGYIGYETEPACRVFHLADFYVSLKHRRKGAGRCLMQAVAKYALSKKAKGIIWPVYKTNHVAFGFYKKIGAKRLSYLKTMGLDGKPFVSLASASSISSDATLTKVF